MLFTHRLEVHLVRVVDIPAEALDVVEKSGFNELQGSSIDAGSRLACIRRRFQPCTIYSSLATHRRRRDIL